MLGLYFSMVPAVRGSQTLATANSMAMAKGAVLESGDLDKETCPILSAWRALPEYVTNGAKCKLIFMAGKVNRQVVADNAEFLKPVLETLGVLDAFYMYRPDFD